MATKQQIEINREFRRALRDRGEGTDTEFLIEGTDIEFLITATSERTKAEADEIKRWRPSISRSVHGTRKTLGNT